MRVPKERKTYCKKCRKHTTHNVTIYKKGKENMQSQGWRRYHRKKKGYGSQPKEIFRNNAKVNKKTLPILTCTKCGMKHHGTAIRLKRYELV